MRQKAGQLAIISSPILRKRFVCGRRSFAILLVLFCGTLLFSACSVESAGTAGTTPSPQKAVFTTGKTYQYNKLIGHSRTTSGTNDNVSVTLAFLDTGGSSGTTSLQIAFNDADTQLSAHFLFKELTNVYMVDDHNARYQAISAKPDDIIINPQQGGNVIFLFPALHADAGSLAVYVNTDRSALETQCTVLKPDQTTSPCGA
jgi:hypothetical protein